MNPVNLPSRGQELPFPADPTGELLGLKDVSAVCDLPRMPQHSKWKLAQFREAPLPSLILGRAIIMRATLGQAKCDDRELNACEKIVS